MSKLLNNYNPITQSCLKEIKSMVNKQINQRKSLCLFDKLQTYDKIIGKYIFELG